jgi:hypothetical protein
LSSRLGPCDIIVDEDAGLFLGSFWNKLGLQGEFTKMVGHGHRINSIRPYTTLHMLVETIPLLLVTRCEMIPKSHRWTSSASYSTLMIGLLQVSQTSPAPSVACDNFVPNYPPGAEKIQRPVHLAP